MLGSFEKLPFIDANISELRNSMNLPLDSLFQVDGYSVRYKVNHPVGNQVISLKMASSDLTKYPGVPPPFNPYKYWIHIYLQRSDSILFRREVSPIDSIDIKVESWYKQLHPDKFKNINIALYWDSDSDPNSFNRIVTGSMNGYLSFANDYNLQKFNQSLCSLSESNLDSVSNSAPFKMRTDFFGFATIDRWDFIPKEVFNE